MFHHAKRLSLIVCVIDAHPYVKSIVERVRASPEYLGSEYFHRPLDCQLFRPFDLAVTCFMVDCLRRSTIQAEVPASPTLEDPETLFSRISDESDPYTAVPPDLVSPYEKKFWYHGISTDPPQLMWRSNIETDPFLIPTPGARFSEIPRKTVHGVFNTPLNALWHDPVAPRVKAALKAHGLVYSSIQLARFATEKDGQAGPAGPVVIWISVPPQTTSAAAVRDATPDILQILADLDITDVVVEWYEGSVTRLSDPPPPQRS